MKKGIENNVLLDFLIMMINAMIPFNYTEYETKKEEKNLNFRKL